MAKRVLLLLIALSLCLITALPAFGQDANITGGDDGSLRRFIARLLSGASGIPVQTNVTIGALPPDAAGLFPLPPNASVIGTIAETLGGARSVQVYFDMPSSPADVIAFYQANLINGWTQASLYGIEGFTGSAIPISALYCSTTQAGTTLYLTVQGSAANPNASQVAATLQEDNPDPQCGMNAQPGAEAVTLASQVIPALAPPDGAVVLGGTSGGGVLDQYYSVISLQTTLPPAQIADHYNLQLLQLWSPTASSGDSSSPQVTSSWSFTDAQGGEWTGILVVVANGADVRFASFQVIKAR